MIKLALALCCVCAVCNAEDFRDKKVLLRGIVNKEDFILKMDVYIDNGPSAAKTSWEIMFVDESVRTKAKSLVHKHKGTNPEVLIDGIEVFTLYGKGLLLKSIEENIRFIID